MGNPHKEESQLDPDTSKGFVRLANEVMDALIEARLPGAELTICLAVIRETWGYNQTETPLARSVLIAKTGISESSVKRSCRSLKEKRILFFNPGPRCSGGELHSIGFNKYFDTWRLGGSKVAGGQNRPGVRNEPPRGVRSGPHIKTVKTVEEEEGVGRGVIIGPGVISGPPEPENTPPIGPISRAEFGQMYQRAFGQMIRPLLWPDILKVISTHSREEILDAFQKTAEGHGKTFKYFTAVLEGGQDGGKGGRDDRPVDTRTNKGGERERGSADRTSEGEGHRAQFDDERRSNGPGLDGGDVGWLQDT